MRWWMARVGDHQKRSVKRLSQPSRRSNIMSICTVVISSDRSLILQVLMKNVLELIPDGCFASLLAIVALLALLALSLCCSATADFTFERGILSYF